MGSFNETCALSNLNIPYGTPVRQLFLTQNPYVVSDSHEAQRGVYHFDNWFLRSPPLKGKYDDYGKAKLSRSPLPKLVADVFSKDVVERPIGFNQYHDPAVYRGKKLDHYVEAAWEGRLLVQDDYTKPRGEAPANWPTWERVYDLFKKAKLPVQHAEGDKGYHAEPVRPGVVAVEYATWGESVKQLAKAEAVLSNLYDCRVIKKHEHEGNDERCLMVVPKGAFDNPSMLAEVEKIAYDLSTHPEIARHSRYRQMPVLAVMVREDIWQVFANLKIESPSWSRFADTKLDTPSLLVELTKAYDSGVQAHKALKQGADRAELLELHQVLGEAKFRELLHTLPFQTALSTHLNYAIEHDFGGKDELLQATAEAAHVEIVMARLHRPWYIPPLGGQDGEWELHTQLLADIHAVSKKVMDKEKEEYGSDEE